MTFDNWFYEIESFGSRAERFYEDVDQWMLDYQEDPNTMGIMVARNWLRAAYEQGHKDGTNSSRAPATESGDPARDSYS